MTFQGPLATLEVAWHLGDEFTLQALSLVSTAPCWTVSKALVSISSSGKSCFFFMSLLRVLNE